MTPFAFSPAAAGPPSRGSRRCGADRLEPRPAVRAGAGPLPAAVGLRRRVEPGSGGGGLLGRPRRGAGGTRLAVGPGGQVAGCGRGARATDAVPAPGDDPAV